MRASRLRGAHVGPAYAMSERPSTPLRRRCAEIVAVGAASISYGVSPPLTIKDDHENRCPANT
jgi:hypothetical protein